MIYNAFSQDHPVVFKEQKGFIIMMMAGSLVTFFILTFNMVILLTLMSPYAALSSLLLFPPLLHGVYVAAVAGEVAKDEKHLAVMEKVGSNFVSLVVECFGAWDPFSLKMLKSYC